ncbi:MAG TPA: orotidine-5'-phosphate decarboxylase [Ignavibacteriales bacterium]|nr:orotidine-5'-phosphate decarboxylase [Ignavibacteriales bacterium]
MTSQEKILTKNNEGKFICVGLDTDINKIPKFLQNDPDGIFKFNQSIIEATKEFTAAYKINFAFYERSGSEGIEELERTVELIPKDILSIADAKRGDIGNTSELYARSVYEHFKFDAITLNAYMGKDSLQPFLDYKDKMNYILVLTSNAGANDFEKLELKNGGFLYQKILQSVNDWNEYKNCGIVFGATKVDELKNNIKNFSKLSVLLPGVGAQGGSMEDITEIFNEENRINYIVNVSRSIIYKSSNEDYAEAARNELISLFKISSKRNAGI